MGGEKQHKSIGYYLGRKYFLLYFRSFPIVLILIRKFLDRRKFNRLYECISTDIYRLFSFIYVPRMFEDSY